MRYRCRDIHATMTSRKPLGSRHGIAYARPRNVVFTEGSRVVVS